MVTVFNGFRVTAELGNDIAVIQFDQGSFELKLSIAQTIYPDFSTASLLNSIRLSDFGSFSKVNSVGKLPNSCTTRQKLADVLIAPEQIASLTS